jgi:hypothetical protein
MAFTDERLTSVFEQWRDDDDGKEEQLRDGLSINSRSRRLLSTMLRL